MSYREAALLKITRISANLSKIAVKTLEAAKGRAWRGGGELETCNQRL